MTNAILVISQCHRAFRFVYPLHRYLLYVTTLSANFNPLPRCLLVTDRIRFKPIRSNAGNGVTDEIRGYTQIIRKFNQKRIDRKATKASILRFVHTVVTWKEEKLFRHLSCNRCLLRTPLPMR